MAEAEPSCRPQFAGVVETLTVNDAGVSPMVTSNDCEHALPGRVTVTIYTPVCSPETCEVVSPLDQAYWYSPGGSTVIVAVPSADPQVASVVVEDNVNAGGSCSMVISMSLLHTVPGMVTVTWYAPAPNPVTSAVVCPFGHVYSYIPGGSTMSVPDPSDAPQLLGVVVAVIVNAGGMTSMMTEILTAQVVPIFVTVRV